MPLFSRHLLFPSPTHSSSPAMWDRPSTNNPIFIIPSRSPSPQNSLPSPQMWARPSTGVPIYEAAPKPGRPESQMWFGRPHYGNHTSVCPCCTTTAAAAAAAAAPSASSTSLAPISDVSSQLEGGASRPVTSAGTPTTANYGFLDTPYAGAASTVRRPGLKRMASSSSSGSGLGLRLRKSLRSLRGAARGQDSAAERE